MNLHLTQLVGPSQDELPVEIVERKGRGHPDSICDALAEEFSLALCRHYLLHGRHILHHNVDKVLLWAGRSEPAFGGGEVLSPMRVYLAGRAVREVNGEPVPVARLAVESAREWLDHELHALDVEHHVEIESLVREGSSELVDLFDRRDEGESLTLANDTSCGVGYAPESELERVVRAVERRLSAAARVERALALGEDVKVMGVRTGDRIELTVAQAIVDRHVADLAAYQSAVYLIKTMALDTARAQSQREIRVKVNAADHPEVGEVYLTVTGTSAEGGDDGQAGRGNRVGGLITPCRPMVMESAAGKNPVTHVGKLYNVVAGELAGELLDHVDAIDRAEVFLVSRIGHPVSEPQIIELRVHTRDGSQPELYRDSIEAAVGEALTRLPNLGMDLMRRTIALY